MSVQTPSQLFRQPAGIAVAPLSLAVLVYALIAIGNLLAGVVSVLLLVGGYVAVHVLFRLVAAVERIAGAIEESN